MRRLWAPQLVACTLLGVAVHPDLPYDYYLLLRWVCGPLFVYLAVVASKQQRTAWTWIFAGLAVLYNPILRVHGTRRLWTAANLLTVAAVAASVFVLKRGVSGTEANTKPKDESKGNP